MGDMVNQFDDIYLGLAPELGLLRLAQSGLGWKARKGEGLFTVRDSDLKRTSWLRVARNFQLRIQLRDGRIVKFDGFQRDVSCTHTHTQRPTRESQETDLGPRPSKLKTFFPLFLHRTMRS